VNHGGHSRAREADLDISDFILVAHDHAPDPDQQPRRTEIFAFFRLPGTGNDAVLTAALDVPARSAIAVVAHQVSDNELLTRITGDLLRRAAGRCPCDPAAECPALGELSLLTAIEQAAAFA
jgi:hypothetical protein